MDGRGVVSLRRGMRRVAADGVVYEGRVRGDFRQRHRRERERTRDELQRRKRHRASIVGGRRATTTSVVGVIHLRVRVFSTKLCAVQLCPTMTTHSPKLCPAPPPAKKVNEAPLKEGGVCLTPSVRVFN